ncbi:MAG: hypothetical protein IKT70_09015, partial [Clostridia bacterium]|nr:hypothetical protein [Clostridia bacterium]
RFVTGHTYDDGTPMKAGNYTFDAEGKMVIKNGVIDGYMYINGTRVERYCIVKYDGNYYFVSDGRKVAVNTTIYLSDSFVTGHTYDDGTPMKAGYFTFDSEGKMVINNGVIDGYLYINGVKQTAYKLVQYDGDYYFVSDGHKVACNTRIWLSSKYVANMTFPDGALFGEGYYTFDEKGKLVY